MLAWVVPTTPTWPLLWTPYTLRVLPDFFLAEVLPVPEVTEDFVDDEHKAIRRGAVQASFRNCTLVPLTMMEICSEAIDLCAKRIVDKINERIIEG